MNIKIDNSRAIPLSKEFAFLVMGKRSNMIGTFFVFHVNMRPGKYSTTKDLKQLKCKLNTISSGCSFSALKEII